MFLYAYNTNSKTLETLSRSYFQYFSPNVLCCPIQF